MSEYKNYTLKEVGEILGKSRITLLHWIEDGKLKAFKAGGTWRIPQETIDEITGSIAAKHSGQIFLNENERLQVDNVELTSGDALAVLIIEGGRPKWIDTTVEHNGTAYYLTGLSKYNPVGLFARI